MVGRSGARLRGMAALAAGLGVLVVAGCTATPPPTPAVTSHDPAWVDNAVALVGSASNHDPVIKVTITSRGATVITRHADSREQRTWFVGVTAATPQPRATVSPTPSPTPTPTPPAAPIMHSATPLAVVSPTASTTPTPVIPSAPPAPPGPGLPRLPQPADPAKPVSTVQVDNTYGNMSLGTFGDTQVLPMWQKLQTLGCRGNGWSIVSTAGWSGTVITHGSCGKVTAVAVNGQPLPHASDETTLLTKQLQMLQSLMPNQVSILTVQRTWSTDCPVSLTADYSVQLGGTLQLRTTLDCSDVTTVTLDNGYLPEEALSVGSVRAPVIAQVSAALAQRKVPIAATSLSVLWSPLYRQETIVPPDGAPAFSLGGKELKPAA
ncbi:MAG TPA: hypothetical protein VFN73_13480 [Propionibacteriaceae bacterium]|nr:hypothetical protein [Propionibacteriaceae bacterium]